MDGKELLYQLRQLLSEDGSSTFLDSKTSYTFLWAAAKEFVARTKCLKSTQSITTVSSQAAYTLNADFFDLYLKDKNQDFIIKYTNGSSDSFPIIKSYDDIIYENNTTTIDTPSDFTILDTTPNSIITGTATSASTDGTSGSTLTDTGADFTNASVGDVIHNSTDSSDGHIISKTSTTIIQTAMFGGTDNNWAISDAYTIVPQGRMQLILNPPPASAGHTVTVYYVQIPAPVYTQYGRYNFPQPFMDAILKYAVFLYKYRDREPDFGDKWYLQFDRQAKGALNLIKNKNEIKVSFRKR